MRPWIESVALAAWLTLAGAASAAPAVDLRGVAGRVIVIPERRSDIAVVVLRTEPDFPIRVTRFAETVTVRGGLGHRIEGCAVVSGRAAVRIRGQGAVPLERLPKIAIRAPLDTRFTAGEGVFGAVGRSDNLDFVSRGCGRWVIANVRGRLRLSIADGAEARAGSARVADLSVAGSGAVAAREVRAGLTAVSSGDGGITVASAGGPIDIRIAGAGNVAVATGRAAHVAISIAGSGAARYGGEAQSLAASVAGSGYISVAKVTGPVTRQVMGAGAVQVGR